jgi:hypothetical protein
MSDINKWDSIEAMTKAMVANMKAYDNTGATKPWDARIAIRDLAYQAGGINKIDMQIHGERKSKKSQEELRQEMEMELGEIASLCMFIATEMGLDIRQGFQNMLDGDNTKIKERAANLKT